MLSQEELATITRALLLLEELPLLDLERRGLNLRMREKEGKREGSAVLACYDFDSSVA